jgi:hypothetical protein
MVKAKSGMSRERVRCAVGKTRRVYINTGKFSGLEVVNMKVDIDSSRKQIDSRCNATGRGPWMSNIKTGVDMDKSGPKAETKFESKQVRFRVSQVGLWTARVRVLSCRGFISKVHQDFHIQYCPFLDENSWVRFERGRAYHHHAANRRNILISVDVITTVARCRGKAH